MGRSALRQLIINTLWRYEDLSEGEIISIANELTDKIFKALGL